MYNTTNNYIRPIHSIQRYVPLRPESKHPRSKLFAGRLFLWADSPLTEDWESDAGKDSDKFT